jgi:type IV secretory pathway VirB2 component (pilin)
MFQRMIDDFKDSVANSVRLTSLAAAMALALFIAMSFLCAAAFVYVLQTYGLIQACLTGAAAFFVVTLIVAACYMVRKNRVKARAAPAKSAVHSALADPMLVATGIQLIRAIGIKRLIPILAVGGLALGFLASRSGTSSAAEDETPET